MAVDRLKPFRATLVLVVFIFSTAVYWTTLIVKKCFRKKQNNLMKFDFPFHNLVIMAAADTVQFGFLVVSAVAVAPSRTAILLHSNTPLILLGSYFLFPSRHYSMVQVQGILLICAAMVASIFPLVLDSIHNKLQVNNLLAALIYILASASQGVITLYKEKSIIEYALYMDIHEMSARLFQFQVLFALLLMPLFYVLQVNAIDGALCVVGVSPEPARDYGIFHTHYDSSGANCGSAVFVIFVYIVSTVVLLQAINHVLESSGDKQLSRCICVAILCSFVVLEVYDYFVLSSDFSFFGKSMRVFDFISIALLLYGIEVYGREDQPDAEVVTNYSPPTTSRA